MDKDQGKTRTGAKATNETDAGTPVSKNPGAGDGFRDSNPGDPAQNEQGEAGEDQPRTDTPIASGLQVSGEFRIGEKIILGIRNNKVLIRHSPQGDEIEVSETTVASVLIDAFFSDGGKYAENIDTDK